MAKQTNKRAKFTISDQETESQSQSAEQVSNTQFLLNILHQIPKIRTFQEQMDKANQLLQQIKQIDSSIIETFISKELLTEFKLIIGNGQTLIESKLLECVLYIAEIGADIAVLTQQNRFYQFFSNSGLLKKVEELLLKEDDIEEEDDDEDEDEDYGYWNKKKKKKKQFDEKNEELIMQSVQIISFVNKNTYLGNEKLIKTCGIEIVNHIQLLQDDLKELQKYQDVDSKILVKEEIKTLKGFRYMIEDEINQAFLIYQLHITEQLMPLFHLNCPSQIHCSKSLNISDEIIVQEIKAAVFGIFSEILWDCEPEDNIGNNKINYQHIIPIIFSFVDNINVQQDQNNKKQQIKQQQSSSSSSSIIHQTTTKQSSYTSIGIQPIISNKLVCNAMQLLYYLLCEDESNQNKLAQIPGLRNAFATLTNFESKNHIGGKRQKELVEIRFQSCGCLYHLNELSLKANKSKLKEQKQLIKILTNAISVRGGNTELLYSAISKINLYIMNNINEYHHQIPNLAHEIKELLVEEGVQQDIELFLFNLNESDHELNNAESVKKSISNIHIHPSNQRNE